MKNLIVVFTILISSTISAQLFSQTGIKIGGVFSNQTWDYAPQLNIIFEPDSRPGFYAGVFTSLIHLPILSIEGELYYAQRGMKIDIPTTTTTNPDGIGSMTWDTRLDYIGIALLAKAKMNLGLFTPYILAGPKYESEIAAHYSFGVANPVEKKFNKERIGLRIGGGTEIDFGGYRTLFEITYDHDFNSIYEEEQLIVNTNSIEIKLGVLL
ncbi:MAG: PorT family protein [Melioribacteraceae bacterium]|nr:PorT family protein [Melioribacteraceae bacterium]MCF8264814.1 PorT family protein [Melioribacteraceae bacterium]MCF8414407.1 PorT family protein [Melioribacteraceae bacterium]MCF8430357.1 PorT family protein [Melioribacteraceae bacterium]